MAISALALGCSEILGIPDGPHLMPPGAAPLHSGPSLDNAGSADQQGASAPLPDGGAANAPHQPMPGASHTTDGGVAGHLPLNPDASLATHAGVQSNGAPSSTCPPIIRPSISDFTYSPGGSATLASFGGDAAFPGGTYFYPSSGSLSSSIVEDEWHLTGTVDTISGFGVYADACQPLNASAFTGIAFRLWGHIDGDRPLSFFVESAAQQVSSSWINANKANPTDADAPPNSGRCFPTTSRYDGSCREPRVLLTVSSEPVSIVIPWGDFAGGSPEAAVEPREITAMAWSLPQPGDTPYGIDIHIDDLRFVAP